MDVEITERGSSAAASLLKEMGARALDPRPAFERTTEYLVAAEKRRFAALGRVKQGTQESKSHDSDPRVRVNASRAGVATGELRDFMTTKGPKAQPAELTKKAMLFGVPSRHRLSVRAVSLVRSGHDPLVSRAVALRWAARAMTEYLSGDLGATKSARWWRR